MLSRLFRKLTTLELEEQILNGSAIVSLIGVLLPWMGGEWLGGDNVTYTGLGFYTSFIGLGVFLLQAFILLITIIPLTGGPVLIKRRHREVVRLATTGLSSILILVALSVLTKVTLEFSRMEIRFGIYVTLVGSLVATLYAYLRFQEQRKSSVQELFHHPEDSEQVPERNESAPVPPPPPPPPAPEPEEHRLFR
ncbi:hypothetical protein A3G69_01485 [Candidatus Peribacteria bacterium RIFCSPLOWO2_12_FULL_53_10]|nr:MAG: hypothetical protein A3B61_02245 [Candidatus Peribacteria bacterium RIFCSPLOWO2_01_FULL_53_10]OGJ69625.1 MAG: hypothetical protein A3G69_01485 [Candidatus Peribacteria bacterium RIFCSPLOWO2_12_FULL_53_10]